MSSLGLIVLAQQTTTNEISIGASLVVYAVMNLPVIIISFLKGKPGMALLGIPLPIFAWVGAIRLAKPDSSWAGGYSAAKMQTARERFDAGVAVSKSESSLLARERTEVAAWDAERVEQLVDAASASESTWYEAAVHEYDDGEPDAIRKAVHRGVLAKSYQRTIAWTQKHPAKAQKILNGEAVSPAVAELQARVDRLVQESEELRAAPSRNRKLRASDSCP